jgi:hypothetical protein
VKLMSPIYVERQVAEVKTAPVPQVAAVLQPPPVVVPQIVYVQNLDSLLSPVALYPDTILPYVLAASTHPLELVQASQALQNRNAAQPQWDPSIQALAGHPDLIKRLSSNISWTTELGNAYRTNPQQVMDTVQRLRVQSGVYSH